MVSKKVLGKIGVFAVAALVSASPVLAVNANGGIMQLGASRAGTSDPVTSDPVVPDRPEQPETPAESDDSGQPVFCNDAVTTASGERLVSTVPGNYAVSDVDGVAVVMPLSAVKAAFGAQPGEYVSMDVRNSMHGELAAQSIKDGIEILAANHVEAVKGPVVDISGYLNGSSVVDLGSPITITVGIPSSFREEGFEYAIIRVQPGGKVSVLTNQSEDPATLVVETDGFGVFALIKAPAGSFDSFK